MEKKKHSSKHYVAVACFFPGWAKDLSAPLRKCEVQHVLRLTDFIRGAEQVIKISIMFNKYRFRFKIPIMVTMKLTAVRDVTPRLMVEVYHHISHFYQITRHHVTAYSNNHEVEYQAKSSWTLCSYHKLQFYYSILSLSFVSLVVFLWPRQVTMKRETEIALDKLMTNHEERGSAYDIVKQFSVSCTF